MQRTNASWWSPPPGRQDPGPPITSLAFPVLTVSPPLPMWECEALPQAPDLGTQLSGVNQVSVGWSFCCQFSLVYLPHGTLWPSNTVAPSCQISIPLSDSPENCWEAYHVCPRVLPGWWSLWRWPSAVITPLQYLKYSQHGGSLFCFVFVQF